AMQLRAPIAGQCEEWNQLPAGNARSRPGANSADLSIPDDLAALALTDIWVRSAPCQFAGSLGQGDGAKRPGRWWLGSASSKSRLRTLSVDEFSQGHWPRQWSPPPSSQLVRSCAPSAATSHGSLRLVKKRDRDGVAICEVVNATKRVDQTS